jgi:mRNA interferase MazF
MRIIRGHLYIVDCSPGIQTKPGKLRPAICVQSDLVSEAAYPSTIVVPTTSRLVQDGGFLRLRLPKGVCGLAKDSDLLMGQLIAVANASFKRDLGPLPQDLLTELISRLRIVLDL